MTHIGIRSDASAIAEAISKYSTSGQFKLDAANLVAGQDLYGQLGTTSVRVEIRETHDGGGRVAVTIYDAETDEVLGKGNPGNTLTETLETLHWPNG